MVMLKLSQQDMFDIRNDQIKEQKLLQISILKTALGCEPTSVPATPNQQRTYAHGTLVHTYEFGSAHGIPVIPFVSAHTDSPCQRQ